MAHSILVQEKIGTAAFALAMATDIGSYAVLSFDRGQWRFAEKGLTQAEARWLYDRRKRAARLAAA